MTPEDKFKFDLEGYLVVKNVHTPEEVDGVLYATGQRAHRVERVTQGHHPISRPTAPRSPLAHRSSERCRNTDRPPSVGAESDERRALP